MGKANAVLCINGQKIEPQYQVRYRVKDHPDELISSTSRSIDDAREDLADVNEFEGVHDAYIALMLPTEVRVSFNGWPPIIDPDACDSEVFRRGRAVLATLSVPDGKMDAWCRDAMTRIGTGLRLDWHHMAGRIIVKALGAVEKFRPDFEQFGRQELRELQKAEYERSAPPVPFMDVQYQLYD